MKPRIALSMIVKNAARDLPRCLESMRGIVDAMVIADTGSTDDTIAMAQAAGAHVVSIPWENDFAKARNLALAALRAHTAADWVITLDADEMLDSHAANAIPPLVRSQEFAGYTVPIRNYFRSLNTRIWDCAAVENDGRLPASSQFPAYVAHGNVRLFRCDPEIYFVARVHESVGPRILELGRKVRQCDLVIHHFGSAAADRETMARKNIFYRELGREKVREMPDNAQAHFELGLLEFDNFHDYPAAAPCFVRACELNPLLSVAWLFLGLTRSRLKNYNEALAALQRCERLGYKTPLLAETKGDIFYNTEKFRDASRCYERALRKSPGNAVLESKLGLSLTRGGRKDKGIPLLRAAPKRQPELPELHDRLIQAHVWLGNLAEAAVAAEQKLDECPLLTPTDFLRAASIRAQLGETQRAVALAQRGLAVFPQFPRLLAVLAELEVSQNHVSASPLPSPVGDAR
ncbi:MAG TPA: tetratricopeptide repeat protein [Candidatus Acidoferrales bacterium]|jgi:tetratricopeptide (TPR) repeat protein|nr:tetratricopeptide repeat protein [Candidatus Acidoferrales bacterium]